MRSATTDDDWGVCPWNPTCLVDLIHPDDLELAKKHYPHFHFVHKMGSDDIRGRSVERSVDAALESGYTPCPVCFAKEIAAARSGSVDIPAGASPAVYGAVSIPAPPSTTVSQPFGLRYATSKFGRPPKDAIKNPYEDQNQVVPGRAEQSAFDEH